MARQGYDLQLTRYDDRGWRATFYTTREGALADEPDYCPVLVRLLPASLP
jgi:hypothetical protein